MRSTTISFLVRIAVVSGIAGLATLRASIGDGLDAEEWVALIENTVVAGAAYAGIGAAVKTVEPTIGPRSE